MVSSYSISERESGIYIIRCNVQWIYNGGQRAPGAANFPEGAFKGKSQPLRKKEVRPTCGKEKSDAGNQGEKAIECPNSGVGVFPLGTPKRAERGCGSIPRLQILDQKSTNFFLVKQAKVLPQLQPNLEWLDAHWVNANISDQHWKLGA